MKQNTAAIKQELIEKLKSISTDKEFILGVISNVTHDEDRIAIIEYIDKGEEVSYEQLLLLSVWLDQEREKLKTK